MICLGADRVLVFLMIRRAGGLSLPDLLAGLASCPVRPFPPDLPLVTAVQDMIAEGLLEESDGILRITPHGEASCSVIESRLAAKAMAVIAHGGVS